MAAFDDDPGADGERPAEELKRLARYQRWLVAVVLAQLALWLGFVALAAFGGDRLSHDAFEFPLVLTVILGGVGGVFVFLLSWELRGAFAAVVFGLATLVPCMGLIVLTLVNGYATTELKRHGVPVGVFGATPEDVDARPDPYAADEDAGW